MRLFLDTNILIDIVANREPWVKEALILVQLAHLNKLTLIAADYSFINIAYIARKQFDRHELYALLKDLQEYIGVAEIGSDIITQALELQWKDFEDCIQSLVAVREQADYIITRNEKDFSLSSVPVLSPHAFLEVFLSEKN